MSESAEQTFEQFCRYLRLTFARVHTAEALREQRPDYRLVGHDSTVLFAEVKEVTPNPAEAEEIRRFNAGKIFAHGGEPGARVRELIAKANSQLRAATKGTIPGLLVIFNPEMFLRYHTEPYAILTAMRGLDVVPVLVPKDPRQSPVFMDVRSGPKKRMTADANTSISGILLPYENAPGAWEADVFHNRHGACPIPAPALAGSAFRHWRMRNDERGWERCEAAA